MLPILPAEPIGPLGGVDLREVWLIAIMLAGVSFVGYVAVKYFGTQRGILLAGAAGGLASSTAVTISNARQAAAGEGSTRLLSAGVSLASAIMFVRVGVIVALINAFSAGTGRARARRRGVDRLWFRGPLRAFAKFSITPSCNVQKSI